MTKKVELHYDGNIYNLPLIEGSENEKAIDITSLRSKTGYITLDGGYGNTGSCKSSITFIDGEKGIMIIHPDKGAKKYYQKIQLDQYENNKELITINRMSTLINNE